MSVGPAKNSGRRTGRRGEGPLSESERTRLLAGAESQSRKLQSAVSARTDALEKFNAMKVKQASLGTMRAPEAAFIEATDAYIVDQDRALDLLSQERSDLAHAVQTRIAQRGTTKQ